MLHQGVSSLLTFKPGVFIIFQHIVCILRKLRVLHCHSILSFRENPALNHDYVEPYEDHSSYIGMFCNLFESCLLAGT